MKVAVTGGAGYLGSILCRKLLENHHVVVLDNILYGIDPISSLLSNPKFTLIEGDIRDMRSLTKALKGADAVIHLASIVGDQSSDLDKNSAIEINYLATKVLLDLCDLYKIKKFLYASTCSVYGESPKYHMSENGFVGVTEQLQLPKPVSLYGETKLKSEEVIKDSNIPYIILRMGTLFGLSPRMRFDLAINLFIAKAIKKEKIMVFGGDQHRPFLHVQDAADAFVTFLDKDEKGIFNISLDNYKIIKVAKIISDYFKSELELSQKIIDRRDYKVLTKKIRNIGFEPKQTIKDAIIEIENSFRQGSIVDYNLSQYSNYKALFTDEELQKKVWTRGPIGELQNND